jgi:hypothetical protein
MAAPLTIHPTPPPRLCPAACGTQNPRAILTPHRLVVVPPTFIAHKGLARRVHVDLGAGAAADRSRHMCCMDTLAMGRTRVHWKNVSDPGLELFQVTHRTLACIMYTTPACGGGTGTLKLFFPHPAVT